MCRRFARFSPVADFAARLGTEAGFSLAPRYHIVPGQAVLLARFAPWGGIQWVTLTWGRMPVGTRVPKGPDGRFKTDVGTVAEQPAFRESFRRRRCLIAADGYYVRQRGPNGPEPWFIRLRSRAPFAFAGLWDTRAAGTDPTGASHETCTLLVTAAPDRWPPLRDPLPVILPPTLYQAWLDPTLEDPAVLRRMLQPYPEAFLEAYRVTARVDALRNDGPDLIQPV